MSDAIERLQDTIVRMKIANHDNRENFYKLKAENTRLKEVNREMMEALNIWACAPCKGTICEKTITMLHNKGILAKTGRGE